MHGLNQAFCAAMRAAGYAVSNLDGPEPVEEAGENVHACMCTPQTDDASPPLSSRRPPRSSKS